MGTDFRLFIRAAIEHEASDILLSVDSIPALRIDGELRGLKTAALTHEDVQAGLELLLSETQRERLAQRRVLDFMVTLDGRRLRGSVVHASGRPSVALRLLPDHIPTPDELGLPNALIDSLRQPRGLILATGPAGSGKTTTVASLIEVINTRRPVHIVTVEDPVEYLYKAQHGILDQQEVGFDTPSFAAALRQVLRHNPDVIMVGEIRDRETAEAVLTIAETGHLVLSTVHANDAVQALDRIISLFPDRRDYVTTQLAMVVNAIINQRLIRASNGGRVLAAELLCTSTSVAHLIRDGRTEQLHSVLERERGNGSQSMNSELERLIAAGRISADEARRHSNRLESPGAALGR